MDPFDPFSQALKPSRRRSFHQVAKVRTPRQMGVRSKSLAHLATHLANTRISRRGCLRSLFTDPCARHPRRYSGHGTTVRKARLGTNLRRRAPARDRRNSWRDGTSMSPRSPVHVGLGGLNVVLRALTRHIDANKL